jgi:hypothetical protein
MNFRFFSKSSADKTARAAAPRTVETAPAIAAAASASFGASEPNHESTAWWLGFDQWREMGRRAEEEFVFA